MWHLILKMAILKCPHHQISLEHSGSGLTTITSFLLMWDVRYIQEWQVAISTAVTFCLSHQFSFSVEFCHPRRYQKLRHRNAMSVLAHHMKQEDRPQIQCNKHNSHNRLFWVSLPLWLNGCVRHNYLASLTANSTNSILTIRWTLLSRYPYSHFFKVLLMELGCTR